MTLLLATLVWTTGCTKTAAGPAADNVEGYAIYSVDSQKVGTVSITEVAGGEARVSISMEISFLAGKKPIFQPYLHNSEPLSALNPIDPATGRSETSPVKAMRKDLTLSYDLLMFTRDLTLLVVDGEGRQIASSQLR